MGTIKSKIVLLITYLLIIVNSFGYINISPTTLDKNIKTGAYEEFTFFNNTTVPLRYKLSALPMEGKNIKDMSKWVEIYPKVVTVYPTESKSFKVYIQAPKGAENGDYGTFVNIKQVSAPKLKHNEKENIGAGMTIMVNVNMGLYGYVGDTVPKLEATQPQVVKQGNKQILKMRLDNKSNRLVRVEISVKSANNYVYKVGEVRAMKNQNLEIENEILDMGANEKAKEVIVKDVESDKIVKKIKIK